MVHEEVVIINQDLSIPTSELHFRFSTSSGPGGQHVNKAETRVTLLFDVTRSPSLAEAQRQRLLHKLANRLDKEGVLQIQVQDSRSQHQNRQTAVSRFQSLLAQALRKPRPRRKTRPSRAAIEQRLAAKKRRSQRKQERRKQWPEG